MFYLGLIVATCYVPGYTGALLPTQWAVLSIVLPWFLWRPTTSGSMLWLGVMVLGWATLSVIWSSSPLDAAYGLWHLTVLALCFRLGTTAIDLPALFKGLALGLSVSSAVAVAQAFGYQLVDAAIDTAPGGLLFNPTVLSACIAIVLVGLFELRLYRWAPTLLPGLWLTHSRGGWFILGAGIASRVLPRWTILLGTAALTTAIILWPNSSDFDRLEIWGNALRHLTLWGNGIGSFNSFFYIMHDINGPHIMHPGFVHNDYIQLWFELGVGAIPIYAILAIALTRSDYVLGGTLLSVAILALFYFPLGCPVIAFIGCVLAGNAIASRHRYRHPVHIRRPHRLPWHPNRESLPAHTSGRVIPIG